MICESLYKTIHGDMVECFVEGKHSVHTGVVNGHEFTWRPFQEYVPPATHAPEKEEIPDKATEFQVGGDHYKGSTMQVFDIWDAFGLDPYEASAVKYILRHRKKNGREDIEKAIHYLQVIMEKTYGV